MAIFCVNQNLEDRSEINIWLGDEKKQSFPLGVGEEDQKNDKASEKGWRASSKVGLLVGDFRDASFVLEKWQYFLGTYQSSALLSCLKKKAICQ